jgi:hypothetical protein
MEADESVVPAVPDHRTTPGLRKVAALRPEELTSIVSIRLTAVCTRERVNSPQIR